MRFFDMADELKDEILGRHKAFLEERIDPDSGLLDVLLADKSLNPGEIHEICAKNTYNGRNAALLDFIIDKHQCNGLVKALKETQQLHLVNYLNADAKYRPVFEDDWPLTKKEMSILDANEQDLADLIDLEELVRLLYLRGVINTRQSDAISSEETSHERNVIFLEIIRRWSVRDFKDTIYCLRKSNQSHIANIFEEGGVVVKVHAEGLYDHTKDKIIAVIQGLLNNKTLEECQRIRLAIGLNVIRVQKGESVVLYVYCKTVIQIIQLKEMQTKGTLRTAVQRLFVKILVFLQSLEVTVEKPRILVDLQHSHFDGMTVTLSEAEYDRCRSYFPESIKLRAVCDFNSEDKWQDNFDEEKGNSEGEMKDEADQGIREEDKEKRRKLKRKAHVIEDDDRMETDQEFEATPSASFTRERKRLKLADSLRVIEKDETEAQLLRIEKETSMVDLKDAERELEYLEARWLKSDESLNSIRKGDQMETIPPAGICDANDWWKVKHMESGEIGYIPRYLVVIDYEIQLNQRHKTLAGNNQTANVKEVSSKTSMSNLPFEFLDSILRKSYLECILKEKQVLVMTKDYDAINKLASVDCRWFQRIRRKTFKKEMWRSLVVLYRRQVKISSTYKINRQYLEENIRLNGLDNRLKSNDCLTDVQTASLYRQRVSLGKKDSFKRVRYLIVEIMRKIEAIHSVFRRLLYHTKQHVIAEIIENGGAMTKVEIQISAKARHQNFQIAERINKIRDKTNITRLHKIQKLMSTLQEEDLEMLSAGQDGDVTVVWIWCQTKYAIEKLQNLNKSKHIIDVFTELVKNLSSEEKIFPPKIKPNVNIDFEQCEKPFIFFSIVASFTSRLKLGLRIRAKGRENDENNENEEAQKLTKLRNKIYVLLRSKMSSPRCVILVFNDEIPFRLQKRIEIEEIKNPNDMVSIEKENSLYVYDFSWSSGCVWKITGEENEKITRWLELENYCNMPRTLSVTRDRRLLIVGRRKDDCVWSLRILSGRGSAEAGLSILLPKDIQEPWHTVETTKGNFIILHKLKREKEAESGSAGGSSKIEDGGMYIELTLEKSGSVKARIMTEIVALSEVSGDGVTILRRFIPKTKEQSLFHFHFGRLFVDSLDRIFLMDSDFGHVVLFDSNLQWNRILIPMEEDRKVGRWMRRSRSLFYDEEKKQLIFGGENGVFVYTLNRK